MRLEEELSTLTSVPIKVFDKLADYSYYIHSNNILTQLLNNANVFNLNLTEGVLTISLVDDKIYYKFTPNEKFTKVVRDTIVTKKSLLEKEVSAKLKSTLMNWKKELL